MPALVHAQCVPAGRPPALRLVLPADARAVGVARRRLAAEAARLGAGPDVVDRVSLAVTEAVANAVVHAYRAAEAPGTVSVTARGGGRCLEVTVADDGLGLVPRTDSPGAGLGLALMAGTADAFEVAERRPAGVEVRLGFALDGGASEDRAAA